MTAARREFEAAEVVSRAATKSQQIAMQPIPKANAATSGKAGDEFQCQRAMTGARHVLTKLLLVRCEDADAAPTARDGHIPLLRICRGLDGRIGEQDVINGLALRAVRCDGVAEQELAKARVQDPAISEFNPTIGTYRIHRYEFTIRDTAA